MSDSFGQIMAYVTDLEKAVLLLESPSWLSARRVGESFPICGF